MALTPMYLVSRPTLVVNNVAELIEHARGHPGKLNYGSAGNGTLPHASGEMLLHFAKIRAPVAESRASRKRYKGATTDCSPEHMLLGDIWATNVRLALLSNGILGPIE